MVEFRIEVEGLDEAQRATARLAVALADLRPFWPRVVPLFVGWMRQQFETEGSFAGAPWHPLSPSYAAYKARVHPGKSILIAEGDLRQAASRPERDVQPRSLTLTVVDPKLQWHQEGTPRMPARPLVFDELPHAAETELERAAESYADEIVRRLGLG